MIDSQPVGLVVTMLDCRLKGLLPTSFVLIIRNLYDCPGFKPYTVSFLTEALILGGLSCQPPLFLLS